MNTLTEIAEFVESVLRLDLETPIRGFDGTDIGPSNEQAQSLANRTLWLKKQVETLSETLKSLGDRGYVASVNKKTGAVTITYEDVGAAAEVHKHKPSDIETTQDADFVSSTEKSTWNDKQDRLVSGETLKTVLGLSLLGEGNIEILSRDITVSSDKDFVSDKEKDYWNAKQEKLVSGTNIVTINGKTLLAEGDISIGYGDVGADKSGAATTAVSTHVGEEDPHEQYLTKDRASESFLSIGAGNQPNGYLQLDEKGNVPAAIADLYKARYIIVDNVEERLAITTGGDITICLQLDDNTTYYLDPGKDPSVEDNWKKGQTTEVNKIISVFGRTGVILAQTGDYNADQITETDDRTFVSKDDRENWNAKQQKLVSGTNLRTINGETILGSSDIEITPDSIGAAEKDHKHSADDITTTDDRQFITSAERKTWNDKQDKLVSSDTIKTINNEDVLGSGNISITPEGIGAAKETHTHSPSDIKTDENNLFVTSTEKSTWNGKQDGLKSGTNIKTINEESILGSGDIEITPETIGAAEKVHKHNPTDIETNSDYTFVTEAERKLWTEKQSKLVSGTNIKTFLGETVLGEGDIGAREISAYMEAGDNIAINYDPDKDKIVIKGAVSDLTEINIADAEAGDTYRYPTDGLNFNLTTKIFKYVDVVMAGTVETDYTSLQSSLTRNTLPTSNSTGIFPTGSAGNIGFNSRSGDIETFETGTYDTSSYPQNTVVLDIKINTPITSFLPTFVDETTIRGFTPIAESNYSKLPASSAFRAALSASEAAKANDYWSSNQIWNQRTSDIYLGITFTKPFELLSYSLQKVGGWYWGSKSAAMTGWSFQGRNSDSDSWVTLDRQSDQNLISSDGTWLTYTLPEKAYYAQYRFLLENVNSQGARPSVARVAFNHYAGVMVKDKNGAYYGLDDEGNLAQKTISTLADFYDNQITTFKRPMDLSLLSGKLPFTICATENNTLSVTPGSNFETIAINVPIYKRSNWDGFQNVKMLSTFLENTSGKYYFAISPDATNYYVWKDSKWTSVTAYDTTTDSVTRLRKEGMTYAEVNAITHAAWQEFVDLADKPTITMAVSDVIFLATDPITPKTSGTELENVKGWKKMSSDEVSVVLIDGRIDFTTETAGTYKILYRFN